MRKGFLWRRERLKILGAEGMVRLVEEYEMLVLLKGQEGHGMVHS